MATMRSIVELDDRVSRKLEQISAKAVIVDRSLDQIDDRLRKLERTSDSASRSFKNDMSQMAASSRLMQTAVTEDIRKIRRELTILTARKHTVRVDADTAAAHAKIKLLKAELATLRRANVSVGTRGGGFGSLFGGGSFGGGGGGGGGRGGRGLSGVSTNIGPIGLSGGALMRVLPTVGPPALAAATGAVGVLTTGVGALGAALVSTTSLMGAFAVGVAAVGVPIHKVVSETKDWYDKLQQASTRLEKARSGTQAYRNALYEYNRVLKSIPKDNMQVIRSFQELSAAWNQQVSNGKSGQRALDMVNSSLAIAKDLVPFVARQMDRFTYQGARLFNMIRKDAPNLRSLLNQTFKPWPLYFNQMGTATYRFGRGFLGLLRGARPLTDWLSRAILRLTTRFDKWANSVKGQRQMHRFFSDMIPVFSSIANFAGKLGEAIIKIAGDPSMQRHTIDFFNWLSGVAERLPGFIRKMTDAAATMMPFFTAWGSAILDLALAIAPFTTEIIGFFTKFLKKAEKHGLVGDLAAAFGGFVVLTGLHKVATGIWGIGSAVGALTAGSGRKIKAINGLSTALKGLAGAQVAVGAASAGGIVPAVVPGGKGPMGWWRRKRGMGKAFKAGGDPLPFPGSKAFGGGYDPGRLGQAARGSQAGMGANLASARPAVYGTRFVGGAGGIAGTTSSAAGLGGMGAGATGAGLAAEGTAGGVAAAGGATAAGISAGTVAIVAAAVVAAGATMWYAWKKNTGNIREWWNDVWDDVTKKFSKTGEHISEIFNDLGIENKGFMDLLGKAWSTLKKVFEGVGAVLITALGGALGSVASIIEGIFEALGGLVKFLKGVFTADWKMAWDGITQIFSGVWTAISGVFESVFGAIKEAITTIAGLVGIDIGGKKDSGKKSSGKAVPLKGTQSQALTSGQISGAMTSDQLNGNALSSSDIANSSGSLSIGGPRGSGGPSGGPLDAVGNFLSGAVDTAGNAISSGASAVGSVVNEGITRVESTLFSTLNLLDRFGDVGAFAKTGFKNIYVSAKDKLLGMAGLEGVGMRKSKGKKINLGSMGVSGVDMFTGIAKKFGLTMTSGYRPGDDGLHGSNQARDYSNGSGPTPEMLGFARRLAGSYGGSLAELIYTPLGYGIKNGKKVPLSFWGAATNADHNDHVHVGFTGGGQGGPSPVHTMREASSGIQGGRGKSIDVGGITIDMTGVTISSDLDIEEVAAKIADGVQYHLDNLPMEDAEEMSV